MIICNIDIPFKHENLNNYPVLDTIFAIYCWSLHKFFADILEKSISQKTIWSSTITPFVWEKMNTWIYDSDEILDDSSVIGSCFCNNDVLSDLMRIDISYMF